ncbi:helix-turn-helix domain-containing protein [Jeotgalibaca porci]
MTKLQKEIVYWNECGKTIHEIADIADCSSVYVKDTLYRYQKGVWN